MKKMTLVVLAAGMGSRFGGLKQVEPMGPSGELLIDYSIYDARKAGFQKVVFIIKEENAALFREKIGDRISAFLEVEYVFQDLGKLPPGVAVPLGRVKPWGTTHAVLCCENALQEDFCVINADDFYGREIFQQTAAFLQNRSEGGDVLHCCMAGYSLGNTVTESGHVSRGVCEVDNEGFLSSIVERKQVGYHDGKLGFTLDDWKTMGELAPTVPVSMNFWGFPAAMIAEMKVDFGRFLETEMPQNPEKSECILATSVGTLLDKGICDVRVLPTSDKWFGVTYAADKEMVMETIARLVREGTYPQKLWEA